MMLWRPSDERGRTKIDWLDSRHSFSFGDYYDTRFMGFRDLRVINEDVVAPGSGFGTHPHRDMEILTYVLEGALEHKDSMGNGSVIRPGDVQIMSAGTGITHSEFNPSQEEPVHLLQIWMIPKKKGLEPRYDEAKFDLKEGRLALLASPGGDDGSLVVHQDIRLYASKLAAGGSVRLELKPGRHAWVQLARGAGKLNGRPMGAGDAAALSEEKVLTFEASKPAEILIFDLS